MKKFLLIGSLFGAFAFAAAFASADAPTPAQTPAVQEQLACNAETVGDQDAEAVVRVCKFPLYCCHWLSDDVPGAPHICTGCCN